jgi:hypothetical protein
MTTKQNKLKPIPETTSAKFMLLRNIAQQITDLEEEKSKVKSFVATTWNACDTEDPDTLGVFQSLNYFKDIQRGIQKQLRSLRYIQKVIKLFPDNDLTLKYAKGYKDDIDLWEIIAQERKPKKPDSRKVN